MIATLIILCSIYTYIYKTQSAKNQPAKENIGSTSSTRGNTTASQQSKPEPGITSDSIDIVVNKKRPLPIKTYSPTDLIQPNIAVRVPGNESMQVRKVLVNDLYEMFADANKNSVPLRLSSGYRSYEYQVALYTEWVQKNGQEAADKVSARPGYSEHQTGLALDIEPLDKSCEIDPCFADTKAGQWLAQNAHRYGFIIRYPKNKESITGYTYEPWHIRYVGRDLSASFVKSEKDTLEEYYALDPAPTY